MNSEVTNLLTLISIGIHMGLKLEKVMAVLIVILRSITVDLGASLAYLLGTS